MEVVEQGTAPADIPWPLAGAILWPFAGDGAAIQAVQLGVQRIGQFTRAGFAGRADDGARGGVQHGAVGGDELLPGRGGAPPQRAGQRQILQVQGFQVFGEGIAAGRRCTEAMRRAPIQRAGKILGRDFPAGGAALGVQAGKERGVRREKGGKAGGGSIGSHGHRL